MVGSGIDTRYIFASTFIEMKYELGKLINTGGWLRESSDFHSRTIARQKQRIKSYLLLILCPCGYFYGFQDATTKHGWLRYAGEKAEVMWTEVASWRVAKKVD